MKKVALVLALAFVYWRTAGFEFVLFDDDIHVYANPALDRPAEFLTRAYQGFYIPLTYGVWAIEKRVFGLWPGGFHLVNAGLHGLSSLVVWSLFGGLAAAFWALHPLQVEAVAWVSSTKDLLAGLLALVALLLYRRGRERWALGVFTAACLAKPSAVVVPLLLIALGVQWRKLTLWLGVSMATLVATKLFQSGPSALPVPWGQRPLIVLDSLAFYLGKTVFPLGLCPDHGRSPAYVAAHFPWAAVVASALLLALGLRHASLRRPCALFALALLPVLGLATFHHQVYSTVADRYAYLALLGPALLVGGMDKRIGGALVGVLAILSAAQVTAWRNNETLFEHTLAVNPNSLIARNNLGAVYEHQGRYREAAAQYREVVTRHPEAAAPHFNLGRMLARQKRFREAREEFEATLKIAPNVPEARQALTSARALETSRQLHH